MTDAILTCSEHFTERALHELRRHVPDLTVIESLSPQHLHLRFPLEFQALIARWQHHPPIYVHHLFPLEQRLRLLSTPEDFRHLHDAAQPLLHPASGVQARVMGRYPYSAFSIEQRIRRGIRVRAGAPQRMVWVLVAEGYAYLGVSAQLGPWAHFSESPDVGEPVPNRAGLKLLEALMTFDIRLRTGQQVLDLGAAPGAWTEILRRRGLVVTAVSPKPLYGWLQSDPGVHAVPMQAEDYLPQCNTVFDMIVNDMMVAPQDSARLMIQYAAHLRPQGIALMTLKLRLNNPARLIDHALRLLRPQYKILRIRQLVSNRQEVTLFLRRKT